MDIRFAITSTPETTGKLDQWRNKIIKFETSTEKYAFNSLLIGLVCVWEKARMFNVIEPKYSRSLKKLAFGVDLDHDFVKTASRSDVDSYVLHQILTRLKALQQYERIYGLSKKSTLLVLVYHYFCKLG